MEWPERRMPPGRPLRMGDVTRTRMGSSWKFHP